MKHLRSSLSKLSAAAVVLGLVACGGSKQSSQASAPNNTYSPTPGVSDQGGSAMGQGTGAEPGPTGASGAYNSPSAAPSPGTGETSAYGSGSQYGGSSGGMGSTSGQTGMGSPAGGAAGSAGSLGGSMDVSTLNDAQLAAIVKALNEGEIKEAQLAQGPAQSPEVKRFARQMITDHSDMLNKGQALFSKLQITPTDNAVSNQLMTDVQNDMSSLQSLRGRDFDRAYIDDQIKAHNQALELIDRMIPDAKNAELKAALQDARPKIEMHLKMAERIQQNMMKGTTNPQGNAPDHGGMSNPGQSNPNDPQHQH